MQSAPRVVMELILGGQGAPAFHLWADEKMAEGVAPKQHHAHIFTASIDRSGEAVP